MMSDDKPQLDPALFAKLVGSSNVPESTPASQHEATHLSGEPDPEPDGDSVVDEPVRGAEPDKSDAYGRFAEHAGQEAADALRELNENQSRPTGNDWAQVIRSTYASKFPKLVDDVTVGEVLVEFGDLIGTLSDDPNVSPDMELHEVLGIAVRNVLDSAAVDDEVIGRILDGDRHLVPTQLRDRETHAKQRRERAAQLLGHQIEGVVKTAASEEDRVLNIILDRAEAGHAGSGDRKTGGGRSIGFPGGLGI